MIKSFQRKQPKQLHFSLGNKEIENGSLSTSIARTTRGLVSISKESLNKNYLVDTQSFLNSHNEVEKQKTVQLEYKEEQVNIASLNHWKNYGPKIQKRQTYSQQSFNKLLNSGANIQEDKFENPKFPTPQINQNLIQNIFNEVDVKEAISDLTSYEMQREEHELKLQKRLSQLKLQQRVDIESDVQPKLTQEILRKHTNKKLINQILFNKMSKNICNHKMASIATLEVLNSFKSLTQMFNTVQNLINYEDIYKQIIQQKKMPTRIIVTTKEFDHDLERQQSNFDEIVGNKLRIIKDQINEVEVKKNLLKELRIENCRLRDQIQQVVQRVDDVRKTYFKQMADALNDQRRTSLLSNKNNYKQFKEYQERENVKLATILRAHRLELDQNTALIVEQQYMFQEFQEQKNSSRSELAEFLKALLKCEDIQIQDNLITLVKLLSQLKTTLSLADFPNYLDNQSRIYILNKSQIECNFEDIKRQIKMTTKKINQYSPMPNNQQGNNQGNRPFHENKLKEIQRAFKDMKKENFQFKFSLNTPQGYNQEKQNPEFASSFEGGPRVESFMKDIPKSESLYELQELKNKQNSVEQQSEKIEMNEITRLKNQFQAKQMGASQMQRLVKSVQAEFGAKQMNTVLKEIFNDNDHRSTPSQQVDNALTNQIQVPNFQQKIAKVPSETERVHKPKQLKLRDSFMNHPDINFNYDPTYNYIPNLQDKYFSSTFFPKSSR